MSWLVKIDQIPPNGCSSCLLGGIFWGSKLAFLVNCLTDELMNCWVAELLIW